MAAISWRLTQPSIEMIVGFDCPTSPTQVQPTSTPLGTQPESSTAPVVPSLYSMMHAFVAPFCCWKCAASKSKCAATDSSSLPTHGFFSTQSHVSTPRMDCTDLTPVSPPLRRSTNLPATGWLLPNRLEDASRDRKPTKQGRHISKAPMRLGFTPAARRWRGRSHPRLQRPPVRWSSGSECRPRPRWRARGSRPGWKSRL